MSQRIQVRTEVDEPGDHSAIVIGPWPEDRRHDLLTFSGSLYENGVEHSLIPQEREVRVPLDTLTFEQIRDVVIRCEEVTRPR